ncbi:hypothetical protein [Tateyamaria sp. 1078]|uniref:hypothetical protein n=1 Tax=Tateyamaria sp. 1078 TaxID=3417464 RepID=UPI003EB8D873
MIDVNDNILRVKPDCGPVRLQALESGTRQRGFKRPKRIAQAGLGGVFVAIRPQQSAQVFPAQPQIRRQGQQHQQSSSLLFLHHDALRAGCDL